MASLANIPIKPASTVIVALKWAFNQQQSSLPFAIADKLHQPSPYDYRIMMVKRSPNIKFFPSAHVFPGGSVDKEDTDQAWTNFYYSDKKSTKVDNHLSFKIAALREIFEETNFFIGGINEKVFTTQSIDTIQSVRNDSKSLLSFLKSSNCIPNLENVTQWARWVTPEGEKRRFDTYFYLAPLTTYPASAVVDNTENTQLDWFSPMEALEEHDSGKIFLPPPQWLTMLQMSKIHNFSDLLKHSHQRETQDVVYSPKFIKNRVSSSQLSTEDIEIPKGTDPFLHNKTLINALPGDLHNPTDKYTKNDGYHHRFLISSRINDLSDTTSWYYSYENTIPSHPDKHLDGSKCNVILPPDSGNNIKSKL
ncbi:hypothetical protein DFA_09923 [Cavenderia fasciculata]|uniref:Nudix hydrolase domain-containing protein n=1 Tax=Cavenderia fasciculata TaxID=261658 RepID=F4Q8T0_CACFS|nr:uncharacterized protein DFA_09923 [Cavenderia fasciculata]EGG15099.1 hypothetical protein DFA_09923 [Cavenderia fasciculata]|eukprot:XP_004351819.1 hypothetical protein DFA_09923 [Cavenderia fasciculata]